MASIPDDQFAIVRRLKSENDALIHQMATLKGGGGGGTSDGMVPLKDYVDKADEAVETRLTAKIERFATKATVWGAAGTVLGIVLAVMAFAGDRFDSGLSVRDALQPSLDAQQRHDAEQDRKLDLILARLPAPAREEPPPTR